MEPRTRVGRAEWQKRIERWKDSGLSAEQFAAELGINAGKLRYWKYSFDKEVVVPAATFELELSSERKLRIPTQFDAAALERLLAVLERR